MWSSVPLFQGAKEGGSADVTALGSGLWAHTWERLGAAALVWLLSLAIPLWLQRCRVLGEVTVDLGMG